MRKLQILTGRTATGSRTARKAVAMRMDLMLNWGQRLLRSPRRM